SQSSAQLRDLFESIDLGSGCDFVPPIRAPPRSAVRIQGGRNDLKTNRELPGNDLLSHPVARAVPSALVGLTAVFGMGTGVSPPLWSPDISLISKGYREVCVAAGA